MTPLFARQQSPDRAFERLYKAHVQDVYRYALMVLRNREDAEDVVQTTFLKAYRVFARGERPRNPRPWLITIAHNTCRTRLRDAMRRPQEVAFDERVAESVDTDGHGRDGVEPKELLRALGALSFNQRSALVMRELEGRSYAEIARLLEVSPSAVETLLFRARRAVRDLDGRLTKQGKSHLRAHLRTCGECASLARRQRARRAALRGFGPIPLPGSLASWGGGTAAGTGIAAKIAAAVAAGAAAVGVGYQAAEAVSDPVGSAFAGPAAATPPGAARQFSALWLNGASSRSKEGFATTTLRSRLASDESRLFGLVPANVAGGSPAVSTPSQWPAHAQPAAMEAFLGTTLGPIPAAVTTGPVPAVPPVLPPQLPGQGPLPPVQPPVLPSTPPLPTPPPLPAPTPQLPVPAPPLPAPPQLLVPAPQLPAPAPQLPIPPPPLPAPPPILQPPTLPVEPPTLPLPTPTLPTAPVDELLP
jgi:RNA polymerase sigma factor (sigma-70 family)